MNAAQSLGKLNVLFDLILFVSQLVNTASDLRADFNDADGVARVD